MEHRGSTERLEAEAEEREKHADFEDDHFFSS